MVRLFSFISPLQRSPDDEAAVRGDDHRQASHDDTFPAETSRTAPRRPGQVLRLRQPLLHRRSRLSGVRSEQLGPAEDVRKGGGVPVVLVPEVLRREGRHQRMFFFVHSAWYGFQP